MDTKEAYKQQLEAKINELSAQINPLSAQADSAEADTKVKVAQELDELRDKQRQAADKLRESEAAGEHSWKKVRDSADTLWHDIKTGVASIVSKLRNR